VIGGIAGGLLGSTIGSSSGRTAATVVGAAGGAYAGNQVQKNMQRKDVTTRTERRCKTVSDTTQKLVGYDVTYRLGDKEGTLRTSVKPGTTLPVKDGQVIAPPADASQVPAG
jgi:uncharacterized protein YcfJ